MPKNTNNRTAVLTGAATARLLQKHYDDLSEAERKKMAFDVCDALQQLSDFRKVISWMVDFEQTPREVLSERVQAEFTKQ